MTDNVAELAVGTGIDVAVVNNVATISLSTAQLQDILTAMLVAGTNITLGVDELANTVTINAAFDQAGFTAALGAALGVGDGLTLVNNAGVFTFDLTPGIVSTEVFNTLVAGDGITLVPAGETITISTVPVDLTGLDAVTSNVVFPSMVVGQFADIMIDFDWQLNGITVLADQVGSAEFAVSSSNYAAYPAFTRIDGASPLTIINAQKTQNVALTDWTKTGVAGTILRIEIVNLATINDATVSFSLTKV